MWFEAPSTSGNSGNMGIIDCGKYNPSGKDMAKSLDPKKIHLGGRGLFYDVDFPSAIKSRVRKPRPTDFQRLIHMTEDLVDAFMREKLPNLFRDRLTYNMELHEKDMEKNVSDYRPTNDDEPMTFRNGYVLNPVGINDRYISADLEEEYYYRKYEDDGTSINQRCREMQRYL